MAVLSYDLLHGYLTDQQLAASGICLEGDPCVATLAAAEGRITFITGFLITGEGAKANTITIDGLHGGPLTFLYSAPNALIVVLPVPTPASGPNVAISMSYPPTDVKSRSVVLFGFSAASAPI